jgi:hypothetical protein
MPAQSRDWPVRRLRQQFEWLARRPLAYEAFITKDSDSGLDGDAADAGAAHLSARRRPGRRRQTPSTHRSSGGPWVRSPSRARVRLHPSRDWRPPRPGHRRRACLVRLRSAAARPPGRGASRTGRFQDGALHGPSQTLRPRPGGGSSARFFGRPPRKNSSISTVPPSGFSRASIRRRACPIRHVVGWLTPSASARRMEESPLSDCRISHNALSQVLS